jgi:hypothetical protein
MVSALAIAGKAGENRKRNPEERGRTAVAVTFHLGTWRRVSEIVNEQSDTNCDTKPKWPTFHVPGAEHPNHADKTEGQKGK